MRITANLCNPAAAAVAAAHNETAEHPLGSVQNPIINVRRSGRGAQTLRQILGGRRGARAFQWLLVRRGILTNGVFMVKVPVRLRPVDFAAIGLPPADTLTDADAVEFDENPRRAMANFLEQHKAEGLGERLQLGEPYAEQVSDGYPKYTRMGNGLRKYVENVTEWWRRDVGNGRCICDRQLQNMLRWGGMKLPDVALYRLGGRKTLGLSEPIVVVHCGNTVGLIMPIEND